MNHGISLLGEKKEGKFEIDRERFKRVLEGLKDGVYEVSIEKWIGTRSRKQNAYYHGVIVEVLAEYWGVDHEDAHDLIKKHCNPKTIEVVDKDTGEVEEITVGGSTAGLNKEKWAEFIERCHRWAAEEFNVVIPDPDPEWMFNQKEKTNGRDKGSSGEAHAG